MTEPVAAISTEEYMAVGALVLALVGIVIGPLLGRVRRHRIQLNELHDRLARAERVGELVCTSVNRGLVGVDNTLDASSALIHRLLVGRQGEIDPLEAIQALRTRRIAVERAVNEVRLLTGSAAEKRSALQQLAYRIGDERTVRSLTEIAGVDGFDGVSRELLLKAQQELTSRLIRHGDR